MKHRNRFFAGLLAVTLIFSVCLAATGAAAEDGDAAIDTPITAQPLPAFTDVPADAWYADEVGWCRENSIISGTGDTTFSPNTTMTRAMLATVLHRAAGLPSAEASVSFTDVQSGAWYSDAIAWAASTGIVGGYGNGLFGTNDPVTREQIAAILWRYAGSPAAEAGEAFADEASISGYAVTAVDWARANGIVGGKDGNRFDPKAGATRAEVAVMLYRYLNGAETPAPSGSEPVVYMTTEITPEALMAIYEALEWTPTGDVAVKLSTGEPPPATISTRTSSRTWCSQWTAPSWSATPPMAAAAPVPPCTCRWRRITDLPPSPTWILWTRTAPSPSPSPAVRA